MLEFESEEVFRARYDAPEFRQAAKLRFAATRTNAVVVHVRG